MDQITPYFSTLSKDEQKSVLEALIFASEEPLSIRSFNKIILSDIHKNNTAPSDIKDAIEHSEDADQKSLDDEIAGKYKVSENYLDSLVGEINHELEQTNRPYFILKVAGGYIFATKSEYGKLVAYLNKTKSKRKLTQASLETLAIIAYKQPVTKPEIDQIRGVNTIDVLNTLLERGLVKIAGRRDSIGKPLLYGTTADFLKAFGLNSISDLPKISEIEEFNDAADFDLNKQEIIFSVVNDISNENDDNKITLSKTMHTGATMSDYEEFDEGMDEFDEFSEDGENFDEFDDEFEDLPDELIDDSYQDYGEDL